MSPNLSPDRSVGSVLSAAYGSFIRAFIATLVVLLPGLLAATSLSDVGALAWAATVASVIAGIRAISVFVPALHVGPWITKLIGPRNAPFEQIEDSFIRAFVGTLVTLSIGVVSAHSFTEAKTLGLAALVASLAAGIRVVQGGLTWGEWPGYNRGV